MNGKTMEDQHITRVNLSFDPCITSDGIEWDLRNVKIFLFVFLNPVTMRSLKDTQGPHFDGAIMQGYPHRVKLGISSHEFIILMSMGNQTLRARKDQTPDRLRVYQDLIADDHLHHSLQFGMMG